MKHIIFDLDGTLLGSVRVWEHIGVLYLQQQHIELHHSAESLDYELEIRNLEEGSLYLKEEYALEASCEDILNGISNLVKERYLKCLLKDMDHEKEVLQLLKEHGYHLYVLTSSFEEYAKLALEANGIHHYFDTIASIAKGTSKANGSAYEAFLQQHHIHKDDVIVVEDALHAIQGVHAIGCHVIAMEELYFPFNVQAKEIANAYVKDYQQLYHVIIKERY